MPKFEDPDTQNPVASFLSNFFTTRNAFQDAKLGVTKLSLEKAKFDAEQANHQADMKQRADQFNQEMEYRKNQAASEEAFRTKTLAQGEAARRDASQERFRAAGGQLFPTPTDKTFNLNVNQTQAPNPASILMPRPSTQPVGPLPTLEKASMADTNNLPMQQIQQPPVQMALPAEAQLPDPERYMKTVPPLGTPAGQEAYFPTLKGKTLEAKEAADEANKMVITPEMERSFQDLGLKSGDTIDRSMIPIMENAANRRLQRQDTDNRFQATEIDKQNANDLKLMLAQLAAQKKGENGIGEGVSNSFYNSVRNDSQSFHAIADKKLQESVIERLDKDGLSIPAKLPQSLATQKGAARTAIDLATTVRNEIHDPDLQKYFGAIPGRAVLMGIGNVGSLGNVPPDVQAKLAQLHYDFNILKLADAKQAMPGRLIGSLVDQMGKTTARFDESLPLMEGSLRGTIDNSRSALVGIERSVGKGWADRSEFTNTLPNNLVERSDIPADIAAKLPLNSVKERNGLRLLKKYEPATIDKDGKEVSSGKIKVYEVKD